MSMKNKVASSSLIEVIIAISIISICIGVSSLIFIRTTKTYTSFENARKQTEIQSAIWSSLYGIESTIEVDDVVIESQKYNFKLHTVIFKTPSGLELFKCEMRNE